MARNLKVVYMGTPDFAVESLDAICQAGYEVVGVVTVPDRQTGRGLKVTYSPVKEYALSHGLRLLQPEKLRDEAFQDELRGLGADIFVVVAFRMLPKSVWDMPRLGTFNLHASLLPQYRGAAPINWAVINGETETGITTFLLNEKIDEGQILLQRRTHITDDDTVETVHDRLAAMGRELVVETLDGLESGTISPQPQHSMELDPATLKPAPKIFKPDCAIDWRKDGCAVRDFVRGLSPYPAATMLMVDDKGREQSFKVYETTFETAADSVVGVVKTDGKSYLKIGLADGFLNILSLQMNGKRRNTIAEFLRGYDVSNWKLIV